MEDSKEGRNKQGNRDHLNCIQAINEVLRYNEYIRHVIDKLNARGCPVGRPFFICEKCPSDKRVGGYWDSSRGIIVCENIKRPISQVARTMLHEMIHAYDYCDVDFSSTNCYHHACTEIRAANLSGDCNFGLELIRGRGLGFTQHKPECIKRIATQSISMNPACSEKAKHYIEKVWDICSTDTRPFDHVP